VHDPADLYALTKDQLLSLEGFADKSAQNLLDRIAASRSATLAAISVRPGHSPRR